MPNKYQNRLHKESSPYLKEHASNPVDWFAWGQEAFQIAQQTNRPILLSIGYMACHWCHVMAEESFSDSSTAEFMNEYFVNIKVDREERPDLDKIYQTAHQLLTGHPGGWPLTIFLTPDKKIPFFSGTYFPSTPRFGLPSFRELLVKIVGYYEQNTQDIQQLTEKLHVILQQLNAGQDNNSHEVQLNDAPLENAIAQISEYFDPINGGFGQAPKFPNPPYVDRLMRANSMDMAKITLTKMAKSGIYDHLAGGFFRYTIDEAWQIPHFEKMLYDNAQLLSVYATFFTKTKDPLFKRIAVNTANWVISTLQDDAGGYYATTSADSEGREGKYYYWDREEIRNALTPDEYDVFATTFGLHQEPNFDHHWHLSIKKTPEPEMINLLEQAKQKLLFLRSKRIAPYCDKKILTSWNSLMIKAMVIAGSTLQRPDFIDSAEKALLFIENNLWIENRLFAKYINNEASLMAYLDDYAFTLDAIIQFLQVRYDDHLLQFARSLADVLCEFYFDAEHGGFFFTASDHEALIQRPKPWTDEATPSGNAVAAYSLLRLACLITDRPQYYNFAKDTLKAGWSPINKAPMMHNHLLIALEDYLHSPTIIILRGDAENLLQWQQAFYQVYLPHHLCFSIPGTDDDNVLPLQRPKILQKPCPPTGVQAYICKGPQCLNTINTFAAWEEYLQKETHQ